MTGYVDTLTGSPVAPSRVAYAALALSANTTLAWPTLSQSGGTTVANIMDVTPSGAGFSVSMPDARNAATGTDVMFTNKGGSTFTVKDSTGATITTVAPGISIYIYLTDNSAQGGAWTVTTFGAGTSTANAASLAGFGLQAISSTLNQAHAINETSGSITIGASNLASTVAWQGGVGTQQLPTANSVGGSFFFLFKNNGTGAVSITCSGSDTIDGVASIQLNPQESCFFCSNGQSGANGRWYSIGLGRNVSFAFSQLVLNVGGNVDVSLTTSQASNKLITFTGVLTGNINVIMPNQASPYFIFNNTSGAFLITVKAAGGSGVVVNQGSRAILTCDAVNVYSAQTSTGGTTAFTPGSAASPSITFIGDGTTGLYDVPAGVLGIAVLGLSVATFNSTGLNGPIGGTTPSVGSFTTLNSSGVATLNSASITTTLGISGLTTFAGGDIVMSSGTVMSFCFGANITAAATTDLGTATGNVVSIDNTSGSPVTITSLGGAASIPLGTVLYTKFLSSGGGAITLSHSSAMKLLNNGNNISVTANDYAVWVKTSTGVSTWDMIGYGKVGGIFPPFIDSLNLLYNSADPTKLLKLSLASLTTATTRTLTAQDANGSIALTAEFAYQGLPSVTGRLLLPAYYILGFQMTNNGSTGWDIGVGQAMDSTNAANIISAAGLTNKSQSSWAVGAAAGGKFHAAAMAANTWYYWYAIRKDSDGTVDFGFSTNSSTPTGDANYPGGYSTFRYIGGRKTQSGSTNWDSFIQHGDDVSWSTPPALDVDGTVTSANRTLTTMNVPHLKVRWFGAIQTTPATTVHVIAATDPAGADYAPTLSVAPLGHAGGFVNVGGTIALSTTQCWTNASAQIGLRSNNGGLNVGVQTFGWTDPRGKPA